MSHHYVYAIGPASLQQADLGEGIDGAELQLVSSAGLTAVTHTSDGQPYVGSDDQVRAWILDHSNVVDRLWQQASTVLPVSFNVIVAPESEVPAAQRLQSWLQTNREALSRRLEELSGTSELRVEIFLGIAEVSAEDPEVAQLHQQMRGRPAGVQRLYQKRLHEAQRRIAEQRANELHPAWRELILAHSKEFVPHRAFRADSGTVPVLALSALVTAEETDVLGRELAEIQQSGPGVEIRYLGPWPPYSFADLADVAELSRAGVD